MLFGYLTRKLADTLTGRLLLKSGVITYLGDYRAMVRTAYGRYLFVDTRDMSLAPHLLAHGAWEPGVSALIHRFVRPGMTVVDVGANVGYHSMLAASLVGRSGRVHCFEPNPRLAKLLKQGVDVNGLGAVVTVIEKAAWSSEGLLDFYVLDEHMGSSSASSSIHRTVATFQDHAVPITVQVLTLDDYFPAGTRVDLLKIDAEGAERHVVDGARRLLEENHSICLVMEFYPANYNDMEEARALLDLLRSLRFKWQKIDRENRKVLLRDISSSELLEAQSTELYLQRDARRP